MVRRYLPSNLCSRRENHQATKAWNGRRQTANGRLFLASGAENFHFCFIYFICPELFFLCNKFYFDQKKNFFLSAILKFGVFFWYSQGREGGKADTGKVGSQPLSRGKGQECGTGSQSVSLWGLAWCQYHVYPECPRPLSTMQLIRLTRLISVPARLEVFLIHSREMGPPVVTC